MLFIPGLLGLKVACKCFTPTNPIFLEKYIHPLKTCQMNPSDGNCCACIHFKQRAIFLFSSMSNQAISSMHSPTTRKSSHTNHSTVAQMCEILQMFVFHTTETSFRTTMPRRGSDVRRPTQLIKSRWPFRYANFDPNFATVVRPSNCSPPETNTMDGRRCHPNRIATCAHGLSLCPHMNSICAKQYDHLN